MALKKLTRTLAIAAMVSIFVVVGFKASAANEGGGMVNVDRLTLRAGPSENEAVLGYAAKKDSVAIVKWSGNEWYEVIFNGTRGFMKATYVDAVDALNYDVGVGEVVGEYVRVRAMPSEDSDVLRQLDLGATVNVIGVYTKWYKVALSDGTTGYIHSDYLRIIFAAEEAYGIDYDYYEGEDGIAVSTLAATTPVTVSTAANSSYTNSTGALKFDTNSTVGKMAELGMSLMGTPYIYGGTTTKGFDCSGFVYYISSQQGYDLPHNSGRMSKLGTKVEKSELQLGDLVFFGPGGSVNHVGMYLGDGVFIHSSSGGSCVKLNNLSDSYYFKYYITARRVF